MAVDDLWYSSKRQRGPDGKVLPASPTKRHGRGQRYRVRYTDDLGAARTVSFPDGQKRAAEEFEATVKVDVSRGQYVDPQAGKETFDAYFTRWLEAQILAPSSVEIMEGSYRRHVKPVIGGRPIGTIRATQIQGMVKGWPLAPSTARNLYSIVASMFKAATLDRVIAQSPCVGISLPPLDGGEYFIPSPNQVHNLYRTLPERARAMIYLGAGCGLRFGEVLGLELEHVDFLRREVHVKQQLTVVTGRHPHLVPPKTKLSNRTVELPKVTAAALAAHLEKHPVVPVDVEDETNRRKPTTRPAAFLFRNTQGRPVHRSTFSRTWTPTVAAVGLPEGTGFHSLRHYFATLLIHNGASVKTVQLALGHSTPMVTLNTYVGMWPDLIDRTRTLVDGQLGEALPDLIAV